MFRRKNHYLFKFKYINKACILYTEKEKYVVVTAKSEADAVWKFINNRVFFMVNLDFEYKVIGEIKAI